jgi:hypothetical protein
MNEAVAASMFRVFLFVLALGAVLLLVGAAYVGLFPPNPTPHEVNKTLPNDKFQSH